MILKRQIVASRTNLLTFTQTIFEDRNKKFLLNWHHEYLCQILGEIVIGRRRRVIINMPPRYSKTELCVINFIAWTMGVFPQSEFIHASYSKRLAANNSYKARAVVDSDIYKKIFATRIKKDSKARDEWRTTEDGIVYATGSDGTITGYGAGNTKGEFGGAIIIDDPHKAAEANSSLSRQNVVDWYQSTMESRLNTEETPIIIIMQRLHEEDLTGFLLNSEGKDEWDHIVIPAIDDSGKALWEDKHNLESLEKIKKKNSYNFSGQYMQRPSPMGGGLFKKDWWKYYKDLPAMEYKIITGDTAQKTKEYNDFSVFQCWGYRDGCAYLIDQIRGKWEAMDLKTNFILFWNKHNREDVLRAAYIEDKASGTGLIQDVQRQNRIPVYAVQRNRDKVSRSMDVIPYIESGFVFLPRDCDWLGEYIDEFCLFTPNMKHKHDDQIDATIDGIEELLLNTEMGEAGAWG